MSAAAERVAERVYSPEDAAAVKGVSESTIRAAIRSNGLPDPGTGRVVVPLQAKRVGRYLRIKASDLDDWFDRLPDA